MYAFLCLLFNYKKMDLENFLNNFDGTESYIDETFDSIVLKRKNDNEDDKDDIKKLKLDELFESNCIELEQFYLGKNEEDGDEVFQRIESGKVKALRNHCTFLDGDNLIMKETNKFGLLIVTNWYMTQNQLDYIK